MMQYLLFRLFDLLAQHTQNGSNFTLHTLAGNLPLKKWTEMDAWPLNSWERRARGVSPSYLAHKGLQYSLRWEKTGLWMPAWYSCTFRLNRSYLNCQKLGRTFKEKQLFVHLISSGHHQKDKTWSTRAAFPQYPFLTARAVPRYLNEESRAHPVRATVDTSHRQTCL